MIDKPTPTIGELLDKLKDYYSVPYEKLWNELMDQLRQAITALEQERDYWKNEMGKFQVLGMRKHELVNKKAKQRDERISSLQTSFTAHKQVLKELIRPKETQVPRERGGGVVMECRQCGSTWWLDENDRHEPDCPAVEARKLLEVE